MATDSTEFRDAYYKLDQEKMRILEEIKGYEKNLEIIPQKLEILKKLYVSTVLSQFLLYDGKKGMSFSDFIKYDAEYNILEEIKKQINLIEFFTSEKDKKPDNNEVKSSKATKINLKGRIIHGK